MDNMELRRNIRRIDKSELEALIDGEPRYYCTGTLTVCYLTLKCGIILTGTSGCLNPDDFDPDIGQRISYENAFSQLWQLEGYARLRVFVDGLEKADVANPIDGEEPWHMRLRFEHDQLVERLDKLDTFVNTESFNDLSEEARNALDAQRLLMGQYREILQYRLETSE